MSASIHYLNAPPRKSRLYAGRTTHWWISELVKLGLIAAAVAPLVIWSW